MATGHRFRLFLNALFMIPKIREAFNAGYNEEKYKQFLEHIENRYPGQLAFRIAETPVFFDKELTRKLIDASEKIVDVVVDPGFMQQSQGAIPQQCFVPGHEGHPHYMAFDFAICKDEDGSLTPKLIELQGFATLFGFQEFLGRMYARYFSMPDDFTMYFNGHSHESYIDLLKRVIVGNNKPENVVLMDLKPALQKTRIDFHIMAEYLNIPIVDFYEIKAEGKKLYYEREGNKIYIHRIFNRLIFDDLQQQTQTPSFDILKEYDIEWITHPNWFYRISKFTLPYLNFDFVPYTQFVSALKEYPENLQDYVLKPLYSFSGQGVIIDVTAKDIDDIKDKENWILQRKVKYEPVVHTPEGGVQCEIRMIYFWEEGKPRPEPTLNLMRMSRGKMIGVRYNKDFNWVGASMGFFQE
jgi:hypothetical protein